nr:secreted RxLR effector protein 161-like [Ziziphus jujuba var. spinosa]
MNVVIQFMYNPKKVHLQAVHRILQYLKGTPGKGILFRRHGGLALEAYTDIDRRSTPVYCTFRRGNLVTWRSRKQNVVARSSAEVEFRAMAQGVYELLWVKIKLEDLKIKWDGPMRL